MEGSEQIIPPTLMVIADSNFINLCDDAHAYVAKLKGKLLERRMEGSVIVTVDGRYGISNIDNSIQTIEVNDKSKTVFGQTMELASSHFDELIVVSISDSDNFINAAKEVATSMGKSFTHYRYLRK